MVVKLTELETFVPAAEVCGTVAVISKVPVAPAAIDNEVLLTPK